MKLQNRTIIVVDHSGSMSHLTTKTADMINAQIKKIAELDRQYNQETLVSVIKFDDVVTSLFLNKPADGVQRLSPHDISARGSTALFDAVGFAINLGASEKNEEVSYVVSVLTDGQENASRKFNSRTLVDLIAKMQATDKWTLTFQLPPGSRYKFCNQFGIPEENCREWEASSKGLQETHQATTDAYDNYYKSRSLGKTSLRNFYKPVSTDLSHVNTQVLKQELDKVTDNYSQFTVGKEEQIRDFVETKTKRPYKQGIAFYQLTKPEKVQPQKDVLVLDKKTGVVWGGRSARQLIGLPDGQYAKVTPLDHGSYEIFIKSTSVNRVLVRGTKVLVEK